MIVIAEKKRKKIFICLTGNSQKTNSEKRIFLLFACVSGSTAYFRKRGASDDWGFSKYLFSVFLNGKHVHSNVSLKIHSRLFFVRILRLIFRVFFIRGFVFLFI